VSSNTGSPVVLVKVGEHDRVPVGQRRRLARIDDVAESSQGDGGGGRGSDGPTGACRRGPLFTAGQRRVRSPLEALEIGPQVGGVQIAERGIRFQALRDDAFQFGRRLDPQPHGRRGPDALGHFVQHQADAPEVGAVIHRLTARLLRRHVGGGAHHDTLPRAGHRGHVRARCRRSALRQAEVEERGVTARADEDVRRFDVTVDDIRGMGSVQGVSDLDPEPQHCLESEWTRGEPVLQRRAL
jgi:hypothetical protein